MTVYKNFLRLVYTKKIPIIISTVIFLLISFAMAGVNSSGGHSDFSESSFDLKVIDNDNSTLSQNLIEYLKTKNKVTVIKPEDFQNKSEEEIVKEIKKDISLSLINAGIIINPNLEKNLKDAKSCVLSFKDERKTSSFYIDMQIQKFLLFTDSVKKAEGEFNFAKIQTALKESTPVHKIQVGKNFSLNIWFKHFFIFFAWILFSLVLHSVGRTTAILNDPALKMRNNVSPVSTLRFALENFAAQLTVLFLLMAIIIGFPVVVYSNKLAGVPIAAYVFTAFVYGAVVLSMTFMLNAMSTKEKIINVLGSILPMALAFISGVFMPQEFLPNAILTIAKFFPLYYFVQANEFTQNLLKVDWANIGMLFLFLILYFTIGMYFSKINRAQGKIEFAQR
ncbi:MAG: ABC transporter permease [Treponema phagedenis]|uniref:ABC transporter permease n=2 Tax=Treponema phagedenis TaxID=162 RepID=UPI00313410A0